MKLPAIDFPARCLLGTLVVLELVLLFVMKGDRIYALLSSDSIGYYEYLPAFFIERSAQAMDWSIVLESGQRLNVYHVGVAIMQAPFFLLAHAMALVSAFEADGYSVIYSYGLLLSAFFYGNTALLLLFNTLRQELTWTRSFAAVLLTLLGTNLIHYLSFEAGMSHIYSFFLFSAFFWLVPKFLERPGWKNALAMGVVSGLILVVRPSNGIVLLALPGWNVSSLNDLKERFTHLIKLFPQIIIASLGAFVMIAPQLIYWKIVSNDWIVFSYGLKNETFNWLEPALWKVLFSPQNGWLIYSPMVIFMLAGLSFRIKERKPNALMTFILLLIAWYIISSWWCWWFGAAYGHRAFVEYLAFLVLPFGTFLQKLRQVWQRVSFGAVSVLMIYTNLRMSFLYKAPWDGPGWGWDDYVSILQSIF